MKETRKIAELANATAVDFGKLNEINEYVLELGPEMKTHSQARMPSTVLS